MTVTAILWNLFSALAVIILVAMLKDIHITLLTYCSSWDVLHSLRHDCLSICWPALIMTLSEYEVNFGKEDMQCNIGSLILYLHFIVPESKSSFQGQ